jgi:16S rRNA (cytosine1402-N4)-methyltransferase
LETNEKYHLPVMGAEVVKFLSHDPAGITVDGTCGTGGHTSLLIENLSRDGKVIACDLDSRMLEIAKRRTREVSEKVRFVNCGYHQITDHLLPEEKPLSGYLLDLGVCSLQLDESHGFAFKSDNALDMRFSRDTALTAADIINTYPREELRLIFKQYGELKQAKSLADTIVRIRQDRKIETTLQLKQIVEPLFSPDRRNKSLARLGQSLRIAVNGELDNLKKGLAALTKLLKSGGRLVVISYHSLEDRIVKNFIRTYSRESGLPPDLEEVLDRREFRLEALTRKALIPSRQEIESNPRARSAKLRAAARV